MRSTAAPDARTARALAVLGLSGAGLDGPALERAWRRFARAHHPDMCPDDPGACARFTRGREAYEALRAPAADARRAGRGVVPAAVARGCVVAYAPPAPHPREWVA
jgi:hypothetical protein